MSQSTCGILVTGLSYKLHDTIRQHCVSSSPDTPSTSSCQHCAFTAYIYRFHHKFFGSWILVKQEVGNYHTKSSIQTSYSHNSHSSHNTRMLQSAKISRAKTPSPETDKHTIAHPDMNSTYSATWKCCCGKENGGNDFPHRCMNCGHYWQACCLP